MKENNENKWYILIVKNNLENKVNSEILSLIKAWKMENKILSVEQFNINPTTKAKGMLLCNLIMDKEVVSFFYQIRNVYNFLEHDIYSDTLPSFITEEQRQGLFPVSEEEKQVKDKTKKNISYKVKTSKFKLNDTIRIKDGELKNYIGKITKINYDKNIVNIWVEFNNNITLSNPFSLERVSLYTCEKISIHTYKDEEEKDFKKNIKY